ncbi:UPF0158 family protein [Parasediminibacterium sp. JCM 36343]|uniref:UPF0158 family protein n=1 Tax=Parasediminibacterium sp. JCM 36343 TaxID=3374279 RepID=UPI00397931CB
MLTFTKEKIKEISEQLDLGLRAFFHKQTGKLLIVPDTNKDFDIEEEAWQEDLDELDENFLDYCEINPMESRDSFQVMADFAEEVADPKLRAKLVAALEKRKPFREFRFVIDNSGEYRQMWFHFKDKSYIEWVEKQLIRENALISLS